MASYRTGEQRTYRGRYADDGPTSSSSSLGVLGPDGKLSAASAAQTLKYAKPHELPSHPSVGVESKSANTAATDAWRYGGPNPGYSAANQAMKHQISQPNYGVSEDGRQKALLAATLSINRNNAKSSPIGTPPLSSKAIQATRIKRLNMPPEMFTEHPPVEVEIEAQRYQDALRASALSMAKQLYKLEQNKQAEAPKGKVTYPGLKEAAQQLAAQRLAKLDPDGVQAFREHYGYGVSLGRSGILMDDRSQALKIRGQTAQFNALLAGVDEDKRQKDRDNLMALAEKRVQERMRAMDQQVFNETGQMLPSVSKEWEAEARAKAEDKASERQLTTTKVYIGGDKYMDMSEVEAIAAARMQPTLDEITETAQKRRERDEEIRLAEEERRKQLAADRAEAQREKDERRMKEFQEKNELRAKMAVEKAERDKVNKEEAAERRRIKDEERMKEYQEKNQRRLKENQEKSERKKIEDEEKAERKKIEDEQKAERRRVETEQRIERNKVEAEQRAVRAQEKAERDKLKAEEKVKWDRIKAEERADRERMRSEQRAEKLQQQEQERQERLSRITSQRERDQLIKEQDEERAAERAETIREEEEAAAEEEDVGPTDMVGTGEETAVEETEGEEVAETEETAEASDAATQIKVEDPFDDTAAVQATGTGEIVKDEMTEEGLVGSETAQDVASRVLGAPVDEVAEADETTVTRAIETEDGIKPIEDDAVVEDGEVATETAETPEVTTPDVTEKLSPTTSGTARRDSRRKSFFNKLKQSLRGARSSASGSTRTSYSAYKNKAAVEETPATEITTEESTVGPSIVGADGTTETGAMSAAAGEEEKPAERADSEGGLYSEPSDTTERPNEERATEQEDNVSSMYATDDADYEEARARTSTSSAERFDDARDELDSESVATTARENPFEDTTHPASSKFQEEL